MNMQLLRLYNWLVRLPRSFGFGVQSPSAYRFVCNVVNERYPYYAYSELASVLYDVPAVDGKRMMLYFRMSNFCQSSAFMDFSTDSSLLRLFVKRGCRHTEVFNVKSGASGYGQVDRVQIVRICPIDGCIEFLSKALERADSGTIVVVEDIVENPYGHTMWQMLRQSHKVSVSYDIYYLGVAFFDTKRHKTNYKIDLLV